MAEPVGGLGGGNGVKGGGGGGREVCPCARRRPAEGGLQRGEGQLDGVVVGRVRREEGQAAAARLDQPPGRGEELAHLEGVRYSWLPKVWWATSMGRWRGDRQRHYRPQRPHSAGWPLPGRHNRRRRIPHAATRPVDALHADKRSLEVLNTL